MGIYEPWEGGLLKGGAGPSAFFDKGCLLFWVDSSARGLLGVGTGLLRKRN